ncbi:Chemotaxis protein CheV [Methylophaga frappieri]|jgi:two-component system chemotaxis response regulator CheV|uniref:Chemotaxis protein CheV n=1 Tax=Methylophaga frappieri (strain ATCC BAA-2434 / DSM 25690 / JAM7) TaxID=754477 RepID=I1YGZ2_METFJ|nr:chemotaxis protein [Methylophaga frappieri]AFJ02185.1 Chemotaxis protein CheV [Methylophaga frappieri]
MATFIDSIDERTKLAGTNHLEVLLFSLGTNDSTGRNELFGINVFKVREVLNVPEITGAPEMPEGVEGFVSLRGDMVPIINLQKFCKLSSTEKPGILMVTEYNAHVQGFLVTAVDTIQRLSWERVKEPPPLISKRLGGLVTAVAELQDQRLVMIMDVEKVLADAGGFYDESVFDGIEKLTDAEQHKILFADDSLVARKQISETLDHLGVSYTSVVNGAQAWRLLVKLADQCEQEGRALKSEISLVLTDVEMPEMDGYVLTQKIKADPRMADIPVIMHSSLTATANQAMGMGVGSDAYVSKFQPHALAEALKKLL